MAKIIAVLNQKGGVGKTTTAINLGAYLAKQGQRILIVDLDPQGNATSGLGIDKNKVKNSSYDVLMGGSVAKSVLEGSDSISIVPANPNLAGAEIELVNQPEREFKLKKALTNVEFDIVLIDCPPALGLLSVNALTAADYVLIPVQSEYYALEGLTQLLDVIKLILNSTNPSLQILGAVLTMYDSRNVLSSQVAEEVGKFFGEKLFKTAIPRNVRLAEAPSFGKHIAEHDKWSKGARAYKALAKEVSSRLA